MNTIWILAATLAVVSADVSHLGYHYKVPQTSYGVPSYQFGESAHHHASGVSGSATGSHSGFDAKNHGSTGGYIGSTSFLGQSSNSGSGLSHGDVSRVISGSSGQYYPSISSSGSSSSAYYPSSLSGGVSSGQYYPSTLGSSSSSNIGSLVKPIQSLGGDLSHSYNQYQNQYQNSAAYKYEQRYVQQQPAQVYKHFYVHSAPEEPEVPRARQPIVLPPPQKHYKIIFVKTPTQEARAPQVITVPQQNEEKTIVYVLSKKPEEQQDIIVPKIEQKPPTKPDVYFIKYKNKEDSQSVISNIVNDYNKGQSVSFSGIGDGAQGEYESSSPSSFGSGVQSVYGSGYQNDDSGSHGVFNTGSYSVPSTISHGQYSEQIAASPVEVPTPVKGFGSDSFGVSHQSFGVASTDSSSLSGAPSLALASIPEHSSTANSISSGSGLVSTTASSISYDDAKLISTSQGVPHETYGPPKFRVN